MVTPAVQLLIGFTDFQTGRLGDIGVSTVRCTERGSHCRCVGVANHVVQTVAAEERRTAVVAEP